MIEIKIPKDIRKYETKFIGPFTKRQVFCTLIAGIICFLVIKILGYLMFSQDLAIGIAIFVASPVLMCGFVKYQGLPMERYFKEVLLRALKGKKKRPYVRVNWMRKELEMPDIEDEKEYEEFMEKKRKEEEVYRKLEKKRAKGWRPNTKNKDYDCYL